MTDTGLAGAAAHDFGSENGAAAAVAAAGPPRSRGLPFAAVVGQDEARLALLLGAVDPGIGGVLLTGEKGTAKTTLVRGAGRHPAQHLGGHRVPVLLRPGRA